MTLATHSSFAIRISSFVIPSSSVLHPRHSRHRRAARAAEHLPSRFHTVPDDPAVAMRASGGQRMDRALKAVEHMGPPGHHHLKRLVVVIAADFASCHKHHSFRLCDRATLYSAPCPPEAHEIPWKNRITSRRAQPFSRAAASIPQSTPTAGVAPHRAGPQSPGTARLRHLPQCDALCNFR